MAAKVCTTDGCPEISPCPVHPVKRWRGRSPSSRVTGTWAFKRVRERVLERDGRVCQYCGAPADQVDHVIPVAAGGEPLDEANLVAACATCNREKSDRYL